MHGSSSRSVRVLVAEDNSVSQRIAAAILEELGCQVDIVGNGIDAIAALRRQRYDLVLMDCQMPGMDGYIATRQIRAHERGTRIPIIAATANQGAGNREACLAFGMDDYLTKPLTEQNLALILSKWVPGFAVDSEPSIADNVAWPRIPAISPGQNRMNPGLPFAAAASGESR